MRLDSVIAGAWFLEWLLHRESASLVLLFDVAVTVSNFMDKYPQATFPGVTRYG
jgi:hypothetical protein